MVIIEESKNIGSAVVMGTIAIFIFAIVSSLLFAFLLRFTSLQESSVQFIITAISFISIFMGGFISGGKGKAKRMDAWWSHRTSLFNYYFFVPISRS